MERKLVELYWLSTYWKSFSSLMFQDLVKEFRGKIFCSFFFLPESIQHPKPLSDTVYQLKVCPLNPSFVFNKLRWQKSDFVSVSKAHTKCVLSLLLDEPVPLNDK